jgi:tRNA pseudouridine55 synthase
VRRSTLPDDVVYTPPHLPEAFTRAVLPIDKPQWETSFDIVRSVRRLTDERKVGHAGTLDPMATGLLVILVGRATKLMRTFLELPKTYTGTLRLGQVTPSYDTETDVTEEQDWSEVTASDLDAARAPFMGTITQRAPVYSAVKVRGERLYKKARRGEKVERPPRQVTIDGFEITGRNGADVSFRVVCSKGTYIRSLAHDFGQHLGVGAHLVALRRTAIGPYQAADAWSLDALTKQLES